MTYIEDKQYPNWSKTVCYFQLCRDDVSEGRQLDDILTQMQIPA